MNKKEINELAETLRFANKQYRKGDPIMTDKHYDNLVEELREADPENEFFKVGVVEEAPTSRKETLPHPMYSLNKEKSLEGVKTWIKKNNIDENEIVVLTPKLDGISLVVKEAYRQAWTRGDGIQGQNSDDHFQKLSINNVHDIDTFGEVIISKEEWRENFEGKISPKGLPYKSSRNTVAGLFMNDTPTEELFSCCYIRYGIHSSDKCKADQLTQLNSLNSEQIPMYMIRLMDITEELLEKLYKDWKKIFPIDGIVVDINDIDLRNKLGRDSNMNPAYAIAYKHPSWSEDEESTITGYKFQISKQGKLKGTIQIDPVIIDGIEVTQATFYNAGYLTDICPIPGTPIKVKRSGDVIPKITEINNIHVPARDEYTNVKDFEKAFSEAVLKIQAATDEEKYQKFIDEVMICPSCGEPLKWEGIQYVELLCTNPNCEDMLISKLEHFFVTCGVEEFGRPTITSLYKAGFDSVIKILDLTKDQISNLDGFGASSADIILDQFNKVFIKDGLPIARFLAALDLFEGKIGEKTIQLIVDNVDLDYENGNIYSNITTKQLIEIKGISDITANIFTNGIKNYGSIKFPKIKISYVQTPKTEILGNKCQGMKVCFSGVRDVELEESIKLNGGEIVSGVSKTTTHLIVSDVNQSTSKTVKARELGVSIHNINDFKSQF